MCNCIISVIVPIYCAEQTLLRCLDSLKVQSFKDFEVLMVDDGSPDRCGQMIDVYAKGDNRFKAFHKENGGVSSARQFGIDHAQGVYTIHTDPDDWVDPAMLEDLYKKALESDAEMVLCDFFENTYKGQKYVKQQPSSLDHFIVQKELFFQLHGSCCNKLVKRSCYSEYGVKFPEEISFCEDQYVICALLMNDIRIAYLPKAYYHYVREFPIKSLSRNYSESAYSQDVCRRSLFDDLLKGMPIQEDVYRRNTYSIVSRAFYYGTQYYDSRKFRLFFEPYIEVVKKAKASEVEKILILLSCKGYYRLATTILRFLLFIKHGL